MHAASYLTCQTTAVASPRKPRLMLVTARLIRATAGMKDSARRDTPFRTDTPHLKKALLSCKKLDSIARPCRSCSQRGSSQHFPTGIHAVSDVNIHRPWHISSANTSPRVSDPRTSSTGDNRRTNGAGPRRSKMDGPIPVAEEAKVAMVERPPKARGRRVDRPQERSPSAQA